MFSADLGVNPVASAPSSNDPPFQKVALLLHGDGTNGAQNNTFVDYSYPGGYAVSFDGSGDYLSIPSNLTQLQFGTGDFTVECWIYPTNLNSSGGSGQQLIYVGQGASSFCFSVWNNNIHTAKADVADLFDFSSSSVTNNRWIHIAITRQSNSLRCFVNGTQVGTTKTDSNNYSGTGSGSIGAYYQGGYTYFGYISNFRVVKGTALYTSNFTPSNQPLTAVSGTQLLTCQSATIVDNSPNAFTITANGNAAAVSSKTITRTGNVAQGTFSPFSLPEGQWSNFFSGTTDNLVVSSNAAFGVGTGNFTVEFFINTNTWGSTTQFFFLMGQSGTSELEVSKPEGGAQAIRVKLKGTTLFNYTWTPNFGQWYHIAVVRSGTGTNQVALYVDGTSVATGTSNASLSAYNLNLNGIPWFGGYNTRGNMSNLRFSNTARYTSNFTPPTAPYTSDTNTLLLTCQSNRFKDNSSNNFTITRNGDAKVTAFSPFAPSAAYSASTNGGSAYFDGSGDYLSYSNGSAFNFGTGSFTVEFWLNFTGTSATQTIIHGDTNGSGNVGVQFTSSLVYLYTVGGTAISWSYSKSIGSWNHFAFVRNGSTNTTMYVNGVAISTQSFTNSVSTTGSTWVGAQAGGSNYFAGYICDLRVTNTAVYTANFTPPTAPLTAVTNTQLLLNFTNAGIIDNAGKNDIETVGNAQVSTSVKKYGTGSMYFDGNLASNLVLPTNPNLLLSGDFTVEFWLRHGVSQMNQYSGIATPSRSKTTNDLGIYMFSGYVYFEIANTVSVGTFTDNRNDTWRHIALTRSGSTLRAFVNGVQEGTATSTVSIDMGFASALRIGRGWNSDNRFAGYIDDLRITQGQALYTSNFTPPTQAFPNV